MARRKPAQGVYRPHLGHFAALLCMVGFACTHVDADALAPAISEVAGEGGESFSQTEGGRGAHEAATSGGVAEGHAGASASAVGGAGDGGSPNASMAASSGDGLTGSSGAAAEPSCHGVVEGTYCGVNLTPAGETDVRYFCAPDALLAKAGCPGSCDAASNKCVGGPGSSGGAGDSTNLSAADCVLCYADSCFDEHQACLADARCRAQFTCRVGCDPSDECAQACTAAFADEPLFAPLMLCINTGVCATACKKPGS
jgi:hypothetical protein